MHTPESEACIPPGSSPSCQPHPPAAGGKQDPATGPSGKRMEQLSRAQILEQEEHAQELRKRFLEFDVSKTGTLSADEMANLVIACFFPSGFDDEEEEAEEEARHLVRDWVLAEVGRHDVNQDNVLDFDEYVLVYNSVAKEFGKRHEAQKSKAKEEHTEIVRSIRFILMSLVDRSMRPLHDYLQHWCQVSLHSMHLESAAATNAEHVKKHADVANELAAARKARDEANAFRESAVDLIASHQDSVDEFDARVQALLPLQSELKDAEERHTALLEKQEAGNSRSEVMRLQRIDDEAAAAAVQVKWDILQTQLESNITSTCTRFIQTILVQHSMRPVQECITHWRNATLYWGHLTAAQHDMKTRRCLERKTRPVQHRKLLGFKVALFSTLLSWSVKAQAMKLKVTKHVRNRTLVRSFDCWNTFRNTSLDQKQCMQTMLRCRKTRQTFGSYSQWYNASMKRLRVQTLAARAQKRLYRASIGNAVSRLRSWSVSNRRAESLQMKVVKHVRNRTLVRSFDCWNTFRNTSLDQKQCMQTMLRCRKTRQTFGSYSQWYNASMKRLRVQTLVARAQKRLYRASIGNAVSRLRSWSVSNRHAESLQMKVVKHVRNRTLARAFDCWDSYRVSSLERRSQIQITLRRMKKRQVFSSYRQWYIVSTKRSGVQMFVARVQKRLYRASISSVLSRLRSWSVSNRRGFINASKERVHLHDCKLRRIAFINLDNVSILHLNLTSNHLTSLPAAIGKLTGLTKLWLENNYLTSLPAEIGSLTDLTRLELYNNQLTSVPVEIGRLTSLKELDLYNNELTSLPAEIGRLTGLEDLHMYNNKLTSLPVEIANLSGLTTLYLYNNQLTSVPVEIGRLTGLTDLRLGDNQLTSLPAEIGRLSGLTWLELYSNRLTLLPVEIGNLNGLMMLSLNDNPLTAPPLEVCNQSIAAIRAYFLEHPTESKSDSKSEAKTMPAQQVAPDSEFARAVLAQ